MAKLYKILWYLAILFILITTITFTFTIALVGAVIAGLFGVYRYYLMKKRSKNFKVGSKGFSFVEVIDIHAETIHNTTKDNTIKNIKS